MRYLAGLAFFATGLVVGFILATGWGKKALPVHRRLVPVRPRPDAALHSDSLSDLTAIRGIGQVYQSKLRDAGVTTYRQLAEADPGELRRLLDLQVWQRADVDSWIQQAGDLLYRGY
jgi:predicted flap endonuclease-1-like 5' DNA nuclease